MSYPDARDNPCSSSHAAARDAAEQALWRMMSFYDTPLADLDRAMAEDPGWVLPHIMKAGFLLSLTEAPLQPEADAHLSQARALLTHATPREKAHLEAVQMVLEGRWQQACRVWDELLVDHPRDALALQWAHLWDFYRGDAIGLRQRPARALPEWDIADPLYPHVLALHAFGLEENNLYPQAEEAGRRALAANPRAPWAVHAVAHVMEMQGRYEDGAAWLRQHQPVWAEGNGFAGHLWWHKALFRLEALDFEGVLRLLDTHLSGPALQITLQRVDAASMLWRLHLLGEDVAGTLPGAAGRLAAGRWRGRLLRLQRRARRAGHAGSRRDCARRILGGALRAACAEPQRRQPQQPPDGARSGSAADARPAGPGARRCRRRGGPDRAGARHGSTLWRQPRAARPDRPDPAGRRRQGRAPQSGPRAAQRTHAWPSRRR
jgi:hypothetical protein